MVTTRHELPIGKSLFEMVSVYMGIAEIAFDPPTRPPPLLCQTGTVRHCYLFLTHSSYLSQPPQPAVVYFFSAGVLFRIMNAKFWPILSHCDQVRLYFRECKHFLVYFLQAHIMWWCIKIDKYGVCLKVTPSLLHDEKSS